MRSGTRNRSKGLRIATLAHFCPKKLGSLENRMMEFARLAKQRAHRWTLFSFKPVHPSVAEELARAGARWEDLKELEDHPFRAATKLAKNYDVVLLTLIPPRGRVALAAYGAWPCTVLFKDNYSDPADGSDTSPSFASRILDRLTMLRVRQLAGVSEYVRQRDQHRFKLKTERTCVIYNGVDTNRFFPTDHRRPPGRVVNIASVGSLIPEKGFHILLESLSIVAAKNWRLRIVGEGPEASRLKRLAVELGVSEKVEFFGLRDDVEEINRQSEIFVHPCIWQEAFGYTVVEGMASGCCVLASKTGGIPELIEDQRDGLLIEPGNIQLWADALDNVITNPELRRKLGQTGRERALRDFNLQRSVNRELDFFEGLL